MPPQPTNPMRRQLRNSHLTGSLRQYTPRVPTSYLRLQLCSQIRSKSDTTDVPQLTEYPSITRWFRYEDPHEDLSRLADDRRGRNPLNYIELERRRIRGNQVVKRRMYHAGFGLAICLVIQVVIVLTYGDELAGKTSNNQMHDKERLDARPPREGEKSLAGADGAVVVGEKPGVDGIKLDEDGVELVETGSDSIPYFPKTIRLPTAQAAGTSPTGAKTSISPNPLPLPASTPATDTEEYTLLGHGVRTVSFLSIKVYVMGLYIRNSDMPTLHAALVRSVAPSSSATTLLPGEKQELRKRLLDANGSREVWDKVLKEAGVRTAIRIVPTRNTDFAHLRDGWVRIITKGTQEATQALKGTGRVSEYDDVNFGTAVRDFKEMFTGKGSTPTGSEVLLLRYENGSLAVSYRRPSKQMGVPELGRSLEQYGRMDDQRIGRLVWLGYLAGANVSSETARQSVVEGLVELVERPVGTVGVGAP